MINDQIKQMFEPGEEACFGYSKFDVLPCPVEVGGAAQYVTLNPIAIKRADDYVTSYRNILIEIDKGTIPKQLAKLKQSGLPVSSVVFSGGKSLHIIISLTKPLKDRAEYDNWVQAIYAAFDKDGKWVDAACKNPSRFTRLGGSIRPDNGAEQTILQLNGRVDNEAIVEWLVQRLGYRATNTALLKQPNQRYPIVPSKGVETDGLTLRARVFLETGVVQQGSSWRNEAFYVCCELARCGYTEAEIYDKLLAVDGYLNKDSQRIPKDAYNLVLRSGEIGVKLGIPTKGA